jgi:uncharacterized membrane protein
MDRSRIVLIASVVANVFLVGALIGALIIGQRLMHDRGDVRRGDRPGMLNAVQSISPERRQMLREVMREQALKAAPDLRAGRQARRAAAELIAAPTYDAVAVERAFKLARDYETTARAKIDAALATRLGQLSPDDRAAFARVMVRGPRGGRGGRGRDGRGEPDGPSEAGEPR